MKEAKGGTDKWCPFCEQVRVVEVVDAALADPRAVHNRSQHVSLIDYPDIHWFRRGQFCHTCYKFWLSAELPESVVRGELWMLRNMLSDLRASIETYVELADQAENKLTAIRTTLGELDDKLANARRIRITP